MTTWLSGALIALGVGIAVYALWTSSDVAADLRVRKARRRRSKGRHRG